MRRFVYLILLFVSLSYEANSQRTNVLSFYAVNNSIDGQPLINRKNVLRFYPVFALHDSVEFVTVTVYYGNHVNVASAVKFMNGRYWESVLPTFEIGEAIQRYEVEVGLKYNIDFEKQVDEYKAQVKASTNMALVDITRISNLIKAEEDQLAKLTTRVAEANTAAQALYGSLTKINTQIKIPDGTCCESLGEIRNILHTKTEELQASYAELTRIKEETDQQTRDELMQHFLLRMAESTPLPILAENCCTIPPSPVQAISEDGAKKLFDSLSFLNKNYRALQETMTLLKNNSDNTGAIFRSDHDKILKLIVSNEYMIDSLKENLMRRLSDKEFAGEGIQKSDIIFYQNFEKAKLLYRNYRINNRAQVALDPAEKLSIFRVRYIPFPVVNNELSGPARGGTPVVFEVGLNFGNEVIATNEYMKPELSIRRLGIATAITPKLFSEDAQILALIATYEFNAYASIGVGVNFRNTGAREPYFSFGINQKAFQHLVIGLGKLFTVGND